MGERKPRIGMRISVDSLEGTHRGKITAFHNGEAAIKWDGGFESYIDVLDLHLPDGAPFDSYEVGGSHGRS